MPAPTSKTSSSASATRMPPFSWRFNSNINWCMMGQGTVSLLTSHLLPRGQPRSCAKFELPPLSDLWDDPWAHSLIKNCATAQNGRLVSIDLKHFYLSGEPPQIAQHVSSLVPSHCKDIFCQALFFLLDNQFVVTTTLKHTYK